MSASLSAHQRRLGELVDRLALETGACVVLASHAAKATNQADELGNHTSRGSGAITDAVRGELALRTMTATEARKYGISDTAERKAAVSRNYNPAPATRMHCAPLPCATACASEVGRVHGYTVATSPEFGPASAAARAPESGAIFSIRSPVVPQPPESKKVVF